MAGFWTRSKQPAASTSNEEGNTASRATKTSGHGVKNAMTGGIDDVRHRVLEEGWFGRAVTGNNAVDGNANYNAANDMRSYQTTQIEDHSQNPYWNHSVTNTQTNINIHSTPSHNHSQLYDEIWGKEPGKAEVYGAGAGQGPNAAAGTAPKAAEPMTAEPATPAPPPAPDLDPDL